jgi:outer membrane protein TolC
MQYAANAAEASRKNLDLVTDAYKRGTVSIIGLVDAQNSALSAEINGVNAVYDFMINYFNLERVVGRFDILSDNRDKEAWYQRIEKFFNRSSPTEASE